MTDIRAANIADTMPAPYSHDPAVHAFGAALQWGVRQLLEAADRAAVWRNLDAADDDVLDALAQDLRSPYYRQDLPRQQRVTIIRKTLAWYAQAGTPAAVTELAETLYGEDAMLIEWMDSDGSGVPGTFDLAVNAPLQPDLHDTLTVMMRRVRPVARHLGRAMSLEYLGATAYVGAHLAVFQRVAIQGDLIHV